MLTTGVMFEEEEEEELDVVELDDVELDDVELDIPPVTLVAVEVELLKTNQ